MKVIYKYEVPHGYSRSIRQGKILAVGFQYGCAQIWVEHDASDRSAAQMTIMGIPTGMQFHTEGMDHVGTAVSDDLVWHVYAKNYLL